MKDIFNLEQDIMNCWNITDDIQTITAHYVDSPEWEGLDPKLCDALMNSYSGLQAVYEIKFKKLWHTFEDIADEYHRRGKLAQIDREDWSFDD